ncbi:TonB-dependent receptor [uncultured Desulfobacter sp.]|uniref:TonB-dependent receptor n=1 Tax=uncultured Desulfobacter sp. TaxID=240139 RepID=UPI002AA7C0FD|nr:TonB-dependent receptor [uncultured Desulfobacter sp.]
MSAKKMMVFICCMACTCHFVMGTAWCEEVGKKTAAERSYGQKTAQQMDSITVTAQKIEENVQEVPISLSVFDELSIEDRKIESVQDIAQYVPNFTLVQTGSSDALVPTMRGLTTESGSFNSSVGMFVDGIPFVGPTGFNVTLMDIERIEVLRGPQGTLYGRGTQAGVVNIITKQPDNEVRGKIGVQIGSDNKKEYSLNVSAPIIKDKFYIGVSGKHYEKDGYVKNIHFNNIADNKEHNYGKINLRLTPTNEFDISLITSKIKYNDGMSNLYKVDAEDKIVNMNAGFNKPESLMSALKIKYDNQKYQFDSISSYKEHKNISLYDGDCTPQIKSHRHTDDKYENLSQEFRLSSTYNNLTWLVGLNINKDDNKLYSLTEKETGYYPSVNTTLDIESVGIFSHLNYKINNQLSISGGLRYDNDDIKYEDKNDSDNNTDASFSELSPKISLEYKVNNNTMTYATVAKGYKTGGVYPYAPDGYSKAYDKETLWSYEIGTKNSFLDNTLILNSSIYYMSISDLQVVNLIASTTNYYKNNAAEATSKGIEFDLSYKATDNLEIFAAFGYNETTFDKYKDAGGDYSGNTNVNAPKYNYSIGTQYRAGNGCYARADLNGYGKMYLDKENTFARDAYMLVNAKIGYEAESFDIYLYADNLFDKRYDMVGYYTYYKRYSPPREVGVQLAYRF